MELIINNREEFLNIVGKSPFNQNEHPNIFNCIANVITSKGGCKCSSEKRNAAAESSYINLANLTEIEKSFLKSFLNAIKIVIKSGDNTLIDF